jgi:hypothetical protein
MRRPLCEERLNLQPGAQATHTHLVMLRCEFADIGELCLKHMPSRCSDLPPKGSGLNSAPNQLVLIFSFYSPTLSLMFPAAESRHDFVIRCKGCSENIPAPVMTLPASWIAAKCPLCEEHRRYLPSGVFQGRLSHQLMRKPVRTADGRTR